MKEIPAVEWIFVDCEGLVVELVVVDCDRPVVGGVVGCEGPNVEEVVQPLLFVNCLLLRGLLLSPNDMSLSCCCTWLLRASCWRGSFWM